MNVTLCIIATFGIINFYLMFYMVSARSIDDCDELEPPSGSSDEDQLGDVIYDFTYLDELHINITCLTMPLKL